MKWKDDALEELSEVDEEEEKRMATAYQEVQQDAVYRMRQNTFIGKKLHNVSSLNTNYENQSIMADCAQDCETNRIQNDNFRLDMTWADQEKRRISFLNAVDRSSVFT